MKAFAELCRRIDEARSAGEKVEALTAYLGRVPAADAIRAVSFLSGQKLPRAVSAKDLKQWAAEVCGLPLWLLEACQKVSGDLAETIALLLPPARIPDDRPLHQWVEQCLLPLPKMTAQDRRREILRAWEQMDSTSRLIWNKMITGAFRIEIARDVMARALARHGGLSVEVVFHRLAGRWPLTAETFERIMASAPQDADPTAPGAVSLYQAAPKRQDIPHGFGSRQRQGWKPWEIDPLSADGVLVYARQGQGSRAGLYIDCTFGVWQGEALVPFARACSGLSEEEMWEVDRFVRQNTVARFGPVRSVRPVLVFEIAFDAIEPSSRHKAGLKVQSARIAAWRRDKPANQADTLDRLRALLTAT